MITPAWEKNGIQLYLGDCREVMPQLDPVSLIVTSPPYYNLKDYSSWFTYESYLTDMRTVLSESFRLLPNGRHLVWNIQPYLPTRQNDERWHLPLSADTIREAYLVGFMLEHTIVWRKTNSVCQHMFGSYPYPPSFIYTPTTEDVHIFRKPGKAEYVKNEESKLTKEEWTKWTVPIWDIPLEFIPSRWHLKHGASFPTELPRRAMRLHSFVGETVLDPFNGLASTGVAAIETGRKYIGIELSEEYLGFSIARLEKALNEPKPLV